MEDNFKYIVYCTVNIKNKHIYVGYHKTINPYGFDSYIGNGVKINQPSTYKKSKTHFQNAVNKYGVDSFKRITLKVCDTLKEAQDLEAEIVNDDFLKRSDVYNMIPGGGNLPSADELFSIEVHQYSLTGEYIKTWKSAIEAAKYFNISQTNIRTACKINCTSCGYFWSDVLFDKLDLNDYKVHLNHDRVYQFDQNGQLVNCYKTVREAAKLNNSTPRLILRAIAEKTKSKGNYYSYNENFQIDLSVYNKIGKVYLYNLDGSFYKEFNSPKECCTFLGDKKTSRLYSAIRTGGLYKNFQVSKEKVPYMKVLSNPIEKRKVDQFDLEGNLIKTWDSVQSAYETYGAGVKKCLRGVQNKTKGYVFKYSKVKDIV